MDQKGSRPADTQFSAVLVAGLCWSWLEVLANLLVNIIFRDAWNALPATVAASDSRIGSDFRNADQGTWTVLPVKDGQLN